MSDKNTYAYFRERWAGATPENRGKFLYYVGGHLLMAIAVFTFFGWAGVLFCAGYLCKRIGDA